MKVLVGIALSFLLGACSHFTPSTPNSIPRRVANEAPEDNQPVGQGTHLIVGNMDYPFSMELKPNEVLSQKLISVSRQFLNCEAQQIFRGTDQATRTRVRQHKDIYIFKSKDVQKRSFAMDIDGKKGVANQYAVTYVFQENKHLPGEPTKEISVYCLTQAVPNYEFNEISAGELDELFQNFNVRVRTNLADVDHRDTTYEPGYAMPINK